MNQRGSASVELVLAVPALVLVLSVMVGGWRIWSARADVTHAAQAAARAASQQRSGAAAQQRAGVVLNSQLAQLGYECHDKSVAIDTSGFSVPVGQPAQVHVTVTCRVRLDDLLVPGLPGSIEARSRASSTLDRHAGRQP